MRLDDRAALSLIACLYVFSLLSFAYSFLTNQEWATLFGFLLAALAGIFHIAESLLTRDE